MDRPIAYLDESGDESGKLDRGASPLFVVALVVFPNAAEAARCSARIDQLRRELELPARFEFHFSRNGHAIRRRFLAAVAPHGFTYHAIVLEKPQTPAAHLDLYAHACARVCGLAGEAFHQAQLTMDMREQDKRARQRAAADIRRYVNRTLGRPVLARVRASKSHTDNLVQLADYVTGVQRLIAEGKRGAEQYQGAIAAHAGHIVRERV